MTEEAPPDRRPRILLDARLTRRKTYHVLFDPDGGEVFRSLTPSEAIQAAIARGYSEIVLDDINPIGPIELVLTVHKRKK